MGTHSTPLEIVVKIEMTVKHSKPPFLENFNPQLTLFVVLENRPVGGGQTDWSKHTTKDV